MAWIRKEILLPSDYDDEETSSVADEILAFMVNRTKSGHGSDGKKFPKYSNQYMSSFEFKAAGKTKKVDLTLSGEMLDTLQVLSATQGKIVIGFPEGDKMNGRAEGNILGTYGSKKPHPDRARNFMKLSDKELSRIIKSLDILPKNVQAEIAKAAKEGAIEIVDKFQFDVDEEQ